MYITRPALLSCLMVVTATISHADSPQHLVVFTKKARAMDRAWALPANEPERPDKIPGLWIDLDGKRVYAIPQNAGFFVASFSLDQLAGVKSLVALNLSALPITDDDVSQIADSRSLRDLVLDGTRVTGVGLESLTKLATLRSVSIQNAPISNESIDRFRAACPMVHVHKSGEFTWCNRQHDREAAKLPLFQTPAPTAR